MTYERGFEEIFGYMCEGRDFLLVPPLKYSRCAHAHVHGILIIRTLHNLWSEPIRKD